VRMCAQSGARLGNVDERVNFARIEEGLIFRCVTHSGTVWGSGSLLRNRTVLAAPLLKQCLPRQRLRSGRLYVHVGRCLRIRPDRVRGAGTAT
jgi:hypothetical protein